MTSWTILFFMYLHRDHLKCEFISIKDFILYIFDAYGLSYFLEHMDMYILMNTLWVALQIFEMYYVLHLKWALLCQILLNFQGIYVYHVYKCNSSILLLHLFAPCHLVDSVCYVHGIRFINKTNLLHMGLQSKKHQTWLTVNKNTTL